jgi:hypothetical protein
MMLVHCVGCALEIWHLDDVVSVHVSPCLGCSTISSCRGYISIFNRDGVVTRDSNSASQMLVLRPNII